MRAILTLFILALLFSGCGKAKTDHSATLRISSDEDASTLDPRQVRDLSSATLMHMLFEGLMHADSNGKLEPGVSDSVQISEDLKTYTFNLRDAQWSNGDAITAKDFVDAWKSSLNPEFPAPNAYQLYVIKGAQAAKEGKGPLDDIGVKATDSKTLVVQLNNPVPYFLELTASHFYFPVHPSWIRNPEKVNSSDPLQWISNGPYLLKHWTRHHELDVKKNLNYWDHTAIDISNIDVMHLDINTALQMLNTNELDWTGSPLGIIPPDAIANLKNEGQLKTKAGAGTHWFRVNTEKTPFKNKNMRQAFGLALNRKDIVEHVSQGNQQPALAIVPLSLGLSLQTELTDGDIERARQLFQQALEEMDMTKAQLPPVFITYAHSERNHKIAQAVQQQWNKAFGIEVQLEGGEGKFISDKIKKQDYQLAIGSWFADFNDPINFLEVFKFKTNPTNQTGWENANYIKLLDESAWMTDPDQRKTALSKAEQILIQEMPVIPIFYSTFIYAHSPKVEGVYFSDLGYLDFKHAFLKKP